MSITEAGTGAHNLGFSEHFSLGFPRIHRLAAGLLLLGVFALQSVLSLSLHNTAHQDEALYLSGGHLVLDQFRGGPTVTGTYATYFSGLPGFYPPLGGTLDAWGGLEAARLFSLACMLAVTGAVFLIGRCLFGQAAGLLAALVFAGQGTVLFLGHFATFDALSLMLLALGTVLAFRTALSPLPAGAYGVGATLGLAVGAKYAALLYVPVVFAILALQASEHRGMRAARGRVGAAVGAFLVTGTLLLAVSGTDVFQGMADTTTRRVVLMPLPRISLAERTITWECLLFSLASVGLAVGGARLGPLLLILLGAALLAPAYQIYAGEATSLHKHIAFGLFFAAPPAGAALARMGGAGKRAAGRRLFVAAVCALVWGLGWHQAKALFDDWPNGTALTGMLRGLVRSGDVMLAEEPHVPQYYLRNIVAPDHWHDLYWFQYTDRAGDRLMGREAYRAAIAAGYFDVVVLFYGRHSGTRPQEVDAGLKTGRGYALVGHVPFQSGSEAGTYWVWHRRPELTPKL